MIFIWTGFILFILALLALDLGLFHRKAHVVSIREAVTWSLVWEAVNICFSGFVYLAYGNRWFGLGSTVDIVDGSVNDGLSAVLKYVTGYIVEKSLSVDNLFVIALIFGYCAVPAIYQHRVLFWGILGAFVMRGAVIAVGAKLITEFHWVIYVFGAFLIFTGVKMLVMDTGHKDPNDSPIIRLTRRFLPVTTRFHGEHFVVRAGTAASHEAETPGARVLPDPALDKARKGTLFLTPLAICLIMVETSDLVFAFDSIPAIFAITADPFLVFTSNVFAILGLRSLYFALARLLDKFRFLKVSLAIVLFMVGAKMMAADWLKEFLGKGANFYLLGIVLLVLAGGVVGSVIADGRKKPGEAKAKKKRQRAQPDPVPND